MKNDTKSHRIETQRVAAEWHLTTLHVDLKFHYTKQYYQCHNTPSVATGCEGFIIARDGVSLIHFQRTYDNLLTRVIFKSLVRLLQVRYWLFSNLKLLAYSKACLF